MGPPRPEKQEATGIGVGLLLIAIGAILALAVTAHTNGVHEEDAGPHAAGPPPP